MKVKIPHNILVDLVVLGILIFAASGCDRRTKHKVLTFFFTGVPPLEKENTPVKASKEPEEIKAEIKKKMAEKPKLYSHTPWAAGKCDQCHENALTFGVIGQKGPPTVFRKGGGMPGKLVLPREELCIKCHVYLSTAATFTEKLWLHTPAAKGECDKCHDAHQSKNRYVLLKAPEKVCISCHTEGNAIKLAKQCKPEECLDCHNPHLAKDRLLLKKDYQEVRQAAKPIVLIESNVD